MKIQKTIILSSLAILMSCATGCSTKSWYEGGQISAKHNCNRAPLSEREECLKNVSNKTYTEYQKEH